MVCPNYALCLAAIGQRQHPGDPPPHPTRSIGQSFSDIPSDLDFAAMIAGTDYDERIGLLADHGVQAESSW
ncbi:hypothetical protein FFK22_036115 [Mycobacterium sp. KBS0706]|uniref:hypothetical protein n=1 Tax=Mycobacterium sp. KBS0706 TaxID=2578109 RepID=UPI00110FA9EC|nr:hypothetical protein [Mycobacterium sp. KBS0706]TSD83740.1 hypothetical protein FFK22_036115 [Mycobacterium sp. KBS0706]